MNQARTPWLFLKRLERWSPLAAVRPMLTPMAPGEQPTCFAEPATND